MTFRFEKIGPVDSADISLGDLTIIAGRNASEEMAVRGVGRVTLRYADNQLAFAIDRKERTSTRDAPRRILEKCLQPRSRRLW